MSQRQLWATAYRSERAACAGKRLVAEVTRHILVSKLGERRAFLLLCKAGRALLARDAADLESLALVL